MSIWGRCRKCDRWFACDDWFDPAAPVPCCPACGLSPDTLRYQHDLSYDQPTSEVWIG